MSRYVLTCDTANATLSYTGTGEAQCLDTNSQPAWIEQLDNQYLADLTIAEGLEITAAILLVWTVGWIGRMIIRTVTKTRYS